MPGSAIGLAIICGAPMLLFALSEMAIFYYNKWYGKNNEA